MINSYYDIVERANFIPYLMAGAGLAHNKAGNFVLSSAETALKDEQNSFAWQVGAGVKYKINNRTFLDLGYKYVNLGKVKTSDVLWEPTITKTPQNVIKGKLKAHEVSLGMIFKL